MKEHLNVAGWIHVVAGVFFTALAVLTSLGIFLFAPWFYGAPVVQSDDTIVGVAVILAVSAGFFLVGIPSLFAGIGLLKQKRWARVLGVILAILALPSFPIGTAAGIYTLWVLTHKETQPFLGAVA
ncbi:MAG: hypothetical protein EHM35_16755 [Planctomycetaceae bacterium]|nr:MAG: hypothetical protein EHM35_16755 [Planctomycetaceae bacterium]